jgi:NADPH2:quinone reductase
MKAVVLRHFGGPETLQVEDVRAPVPGPGEVQIAVAAAGTNPVDAGNRQDGDWARLTLPCILGYDVAGIVEAVGEGVRELSPGDRVMALTPFPSGAGGYAEQVVVPADHAVRVAGSVSLVDAAASPVAGCTALEVLDRLALSPGQSVLVLGASGGVGSFLLPMAVSRGLRVVAVGGATSHAWMTEAGAIAGIDYRAEDVARRALEIAAGPVDGIADLVGGIILAQCLPALKDHGVMASIATPELDLDPVLDHNQRFEGVLIRNDAARLRRLADLLATGVVRPRVARTYPLQRAAEAHALLDSGRAGGKIVLTMRDL